MHEHIDAYAWTCACMHTYACTDIVMFKQLWWLKLRFFKAKNVQKIYFDLNIKECVIYQN